MKPHSHIIDLAILMRNSPIFRQSRDVDRKRQDINDINVSCRINLNIKTTFAFDYFDFCCFKIIQPLHLFRWLFWFSVLMLIGKKHINSHFPPMSAGWSSSREWMSPMQSREKNRSHTMLPTTLWVWSLASPVHHRESQLETPGFRHLLTLQEQPWVKRTNGWRAPKWMGFWKRWFSGFKKYGPCLVSMWNF